MELWVATDLSPAAEPAVELGIRWAKAHDAALVLLHVVHDPELAPAFGNDVPGDVIRARESLAAVAARAGCPCRIEVRTAEDIPAAIVAAASGASYLLLGSHGKSGLERLRLGSVATSVLRQSQVPLVCLPPPSQG